MNTQRYIYWQDEEFRIGYLEEFPDYWTQGETLEELKKTYETFFSISQGGIFLVFGIWRNLRFNETF